MLKKEAEFLIDTCMVQPKSNGIKLFNANVPELPQFTKGAARLYRSIVKSVRLKNWRTDQVEDGICSTKLGRLAGMSQLRTVEKTKQYIYRLQKEGLVTIQKGTGKSGQDEYRVTPSRLKDFPRVTPTVAKTPAQRTKEWRERQRAEITALKAKINQLEGAQK